MVDNFADSVLGFLHHVDVGDDAEFWGYMLHPPHPIAFQNSICRPLSLTASSFPPMLKPALDLQ
jgi:hypothetical protein